MNRQRDIVIPIYPHYTLKEDVGYKSNETQYTKNTYFTPTSTMTCLGFEQTIFSAK